MFDGCSMLPSAGLTQSIALESRTDLCRSPTSYTLRYSSNHLHGRLCQNISFWRR